MNGTILDAPSGEAERAAAERAAAERAAEEARAKQEADAHISDLRARLDEIDAKMISLWQERAAISREVGQIRVAAGGTRLVLSREQEILDRFRNALGADGAQLALLVLRAGRGKLV